MDCKAIRESVLDLLAGETPRASQEEIRSHMAGCDTCRAALPALAQDHVAINTVFMPRKYAPPGPEILVKILARARSTPFPVLAGKLSAYRDRFVRLAAADPASAGERAPVLHRLEIEGEPLDVVCHTKEEFVLRLSIVDRATGGTSHLLDGAEVLFPSGRRERIVRGGVDVGLQEFLSEPGFALVRPDGTLLHVREP